MDQSDQRRWFNYSPHTTCREGSLHCVDNSTLWTLYEKPRGRPTVAIPTPAKRNANLPYEPMKPGGTRKRYWAKSNRQGTHHSSS